MNQISLDDLVDTAQTELEAALRGASLCSVSRAPHQGTTDVKFKEGRWYTLRDIQRHVTAGVAVSQAIDAVSQEVLRRTPSGDIWATYRAGAMSALEDAARSAKG